MRGGSGTVCVFALVLVVVAAAGEDREREGEEEVMLAGERMCGGRRCRHRLKSGEGKTVRALTRMLVTGSSRVRCGLNWYLCVARGKGVLVS